MTTDEIGWLIELARPGAQPRYWCGGVDSADPDDWTTDANEAIRFARSVDAERVGNTLEQPVIATEHMWPRVETVKP